MQKKTISILLRIAIGVALFIYVLRSAESGELHAALSAISLSTLLAIVAGYSLTLFVSGYRWYLILRKAGFEVGYSKVVGLQFVGQYLNCFGFGTVGGDVAKAVLVAAGGAGRKDVAVASVVVDRVIGMVVLALLGLCASLLIRVGTLPPSFTLVAIGFVVCAIIGWCFAHPIIELVEKRLPKIGSKLRQLLIALPREPQSVALISFVALVFHLLQIALFWEMTSEMGVTIPLQYLLVTLPFANLISTLPVSWMGLGVRENLYVLFFVPLYLTHEQAILCGIVWLGAMTLAGAIGGGLAVLTGKLGTLRRQEA